jgi:post-segregation antitoxin (ccd killing protein)
VTSVVLSVRVRRELREEAERLGINIREVVERALEEEIRRVKMERLKTVIGEALKAMNVGVEEWVEAIRESRLER